MKGNRPEKCFNKSLHYIQASLSTHKWSETVQPYESVDCNSAFLVKLPPNTVEVFYKHMSLLSSLWLIHFIHHTFSQKQINITNKTHTLIHIMVCTTIHLCKSSPIVDSFYVSNPCFSFFLCLPLCSYHFRSYSRRRPCFP